MLIGNGVSLWKGTDGFTCRKHNGDSVIDYMLFLEAILNSRQTFKLGQWMPESDHQTLCIDLTCKHVNPNHSMEHSYLCIDFKKAPTYADMVEQML